MSMGSGFRRWGIRVSGDTWDIDQWRATLKAPFDPFLENVTDAAESYPVVRFASLERLALAADVYREAKELFTLLNSSMRAATDSDIVGMSAVIETLPDQPPRQHKFVEASGATFRLRSSGAAISVYDKHGKLVVEPPKPSRAQAWMRAAMLDPEIATALNYMNGHPSWVELYKAYDLVKFRPNGGISKSEIKRFTQTANAGPRHPADEDHRPHKRPMELWEARSLITQWISLVIDDVLSKNL
jgi:hypothetical protein